MGGLALQLSGLAMVVMGILETRARLGRSLTEVARGLLSRFRSAAAAAPTTRALSGETPLIFSSQGDLGTAVHHTPEEHLALLETAVNTARAEAGAAVRKEAGERAAALEAERLAREASDQEILKQLQREIIRKHPQELLGTLVVAVGISLATAPMKLHASCA